MKERNNSKLPEKQLDNHELEKTGIEQQERLRNKMEQRAERSKETSRETADKNHERAKELAHEADRHRPELGKNSEKELDRQPTISSKAKRKEAYTATMNEMRSHLSPTGRSFSKVIHNPVVEAVSEVTGKTVARPNAILGGSMMAFFVVLAVFLVARHYGYPLSGSETILAFAVGWLLGIVFDYLRVMITGRRT